MVWYHCKMQPRLYSFSTFSSQSFRSGRKRKNKSSARNRHRRSCHKRPLQSQSYFPCHLQRCPCAPCHRQPDNPDPFHQESPDNTLLLPRLLSESARSTHDTRPKLPVSADLWQYTKKGSLEGANTDKGYCDLVYSYMEATSIKFTKPTLTMKKNTTAQATVKIKPNGCTDRKSFTSSNPKVVAVNKKTGKLTAKKAGKATITVTTGSGRKAKMKVVVK